MAGEAVSERAVDEDRSAEDPNSSDLAALVDLRLHGPYEDTAFSRIAGLAEVDGIGGGDLYAHGSIPKERGLWFDSSDAPLGRLCSQQYRRRARQTERPQPRPLSRPRSRLAYELESQTELAIRVAFMETAGGQEVLEQIHEVARMLNGLLAKVRNCEHPPPLANRFTR